MSASVRRPTERAPFARYRDVLDSLGFRPSRRLGQNFLLDASLHRAIADDADLAATDVVLEIGAGLGFMTRELAVRAGRVVAVEIDDRLVGVLRDELAPFGDRVELVAGDALARGDAEVETPTDGDRVGIARPVLAALDRARAAVAADDEVALRVVANLPYAVSGPLLGALARLPWAPTALVVLVQKELADRLAARVGTADYGALTATLGAQFDVAITRRVGREVFRPRPNVDSAVVRLTRRTEGGAAAWDAAERAAFGAFVRALFGQRRKQLRGVLGRVAAGAADDARAAAVRACGERRAQELSPDEHVRLWRQLFPREG